MKQCSKCKEWKEAKEFSKDKTRKDKLSPHCKECVRNYGKIWRQRDTSREIIKKAKVRYRQTENGKFKEKEYSKTEKSKSSHLNWIRQWRQTENGKVRTTFYVRRWEEQNPTKKQAHLAVMSAVDSNRLPHISTQKCKECNSEAQVYHHWSYEPEHWLNVVPLCRQCHVNIHKAAHQ